MKIVKEKFYENLETPEGETWVAESLKPLEEIPTKELALPEELQSLEDETKEFRNRFWCCRCFSTILIFTQSFRLILAVMVTLDAPFYVACIEFIVCDSLFALWWYFGIFKFARYCNGGRRLSKI